MNGWMNERTNKWINNIICIFKLDGPFLVSKALLQSLFVIPGVPLPSAIAQEENPRLTTESTPNATAQSTVLSEKSRNHADIASSSSLQSHVHPPPWTWGCSDHQLAHLPRRDETVGQGRLVEQWARLRRWGRGCYRRTTGKTHLLILLPSHVNRSQIPQMVVKGLIRERNLLVQIPGLPLKTRWLWGSYSTWLSMFPHSSRDTN